MDMEVATAAGSPPPHRTQGEFESLHQDMMVGVGEWGYSPLELSDPVPKKKGMVQLWHGTEDLVVRQVMSWHIARELSWICYRELPDAGHLFLLNYGMGKVIIRSLLQLD